nr:CFEM domain-containing protein [Colletotrichum truncatum]KAF6798349.1 CFEM domain-containing protein [Colletotrichum truncatum]
MILGVEERGHGTYIDDGQSLSLRFRITQPVLDGSLARMLSISPALLALLVLFQQWFSPTLGFEIPDSVNLSSWTLPPCFAPCLPGFRVYSDKCGIGKVPSMFKEHPSYVPHIASVVAVETVCLGLRLACKAYQFVLWGPEDFFLVTAYILSVATLPLSAIKAQVGSVSNYWTLNFDNIAIFTKANIAYNILCAFSLGFVKISVVFFFLQIFKTSSKSYRGFLWGTIAFIACLTSSFIFAQLLMCNRLSCLWINSGEPWQGCKCRDFWEGQGGYPIANATLDLWLILLPAKQILKTQLHWKQKWHAVAMLSLGIMHVSRIPCFCVERPFMLTPARTFITAVMRVVSVRARLTVVGADPLDLQLWYALEAATAFVVACVPFIRLMMVRKIIPFIKAKFVLWFLPSQEPSTSQQTVLEPTSPRNRNSDLVLSFSDQNYLHMVESAEPVSSEDHYKHAVHLGTGPISDEPFPHQGLKPSVVAEYATNNKDEKLNIPTTSDPMALRRYGFVINVVDVDARPVMWNTETKSKRSRPLEADRRSL